MAPGARVADTVTHVPIIVATRGGSVKRKLDMPDPTPQLLGKPCRSICLQVYPARLSLSILDHLPGHERAASLTMPRQEVAGPVRTGVNLVRSGNAGYP